MNSKRETNLFFYLDESRKVRYATDKFLYQEKENEFRCNLCSLFNCIPPISSDIIEDVQPDLFGHVIRKHSDTIDHPIKWLK